MEMRQKRISVYKALMRRRVFTNWTNTLLRTVNKQIVDTFNPSERALLEAALEIVLGKSDRKFKELTHDCKTREKEAFLNKAEQFKKNYFKSDQGQDVNRQTVIQFIWDLIEFSHISPGKGLWEIENAPMNAKEILLKWLNSKLRGRKVKNFTSEWNDGTVLCELINALEPGLVPARLYLQAGWPQRTVKTAMETAEKAWGIPIILSPEDMISTEVDELSVMTYVALIFEFDLVRTSANQKMPTNKSASQGSSFNNSANQTTSFPANQCTHLNDNSTNQNPSSERSTNQRSSLSNNHNKRKQTVVSENINENIKRKTEIGKIGKEIEYRLNLHDVNANEITVSVEFKPAEKVKEDYKPNLKVFSMGKGRFRVKYTPNLAGSYRLSMYYRDEHIAESPYCINVLPTIQNGLIEPNNRNDFNNNAKNHDKARSNGDRIKEKSDDLLAKDGFYGFDGEGLKQATAGKLAVFTVITDNRDKGPLSVCINCPAVSLPIPHVKTTYSKNYSTHTVAYMPTLAGTYNIYVRWGLKLINGKAFEVKVSDHDTRQAKLSYSLENQNSRKRQSTQFSHIKVYHSSSSLDPNVIRDTEELEKLLHRYGIKRSASDDMWVSIDVELQKDERDLIFRRAGTSRLPLLFIHEECLGSFEDVCELDRKNELEERLMYKVRKV